eukprot:COSAG06_NODE_33480_length_489_cov_0.882051_1_plen_124_part_10
MSSSPISICYLFIQLAASAFSVNVPWTLDWPLPHIVNIFAVNLDWFGLEAGFVWTLLGVAVFGSANAAYGYFFWQGAFKFDRDGSTEIKYITYEDHVRRPDDDIFRQLHRVPAVRLAVTRVLLP